MWNKRLTLCVALLALPLAARTVPTAKPEDVGLSSERLQRINQTVQRYIDDNQVSGAVTLVARKGRIAHFAAQGLMDIESKKPMAKDAIFRLASSSKPITALAIMMLVEEGKVRLTDPVSRFIPEFKDSKVAVAKPSAPAPGPPGQPPPAPEYYLVPANHDITIRELLTHTSGLATRGGITAREAAKVGQSRKPTDRLSDAIPRLGALPLDFQPGTKWQYSAGAAFGVLGRVVEVASNLPFDQFLRQRVFEPLGMKDTFFGVPADRASRLPTLYRRTAQGLERSENQRGLSNDVYFSGASGLASTAEDYLQYAQMLANGGQLNGKRLLSPRTVELMFSNHVGDVVDLVTFQSFNLGMGFGLGGSVVLDSVKGTGPRPNGSYGWDGVFGTHWWVDPKDKLIAILWIQTPDYWALARDFDNAVVQAVVD